VRPLYGPSSPTTLEYTSYLELTVKTSSGADFAQSINSLKVLSGITPRFRTGFLHADKSLVAIDALAIAQGKNKIKYNKGFLISQMLQG
jgi:hypothetical protein